MIFLNIPWMKKSPNRHLKRVFIQYCTPGQLKEYHKELVGRVESLWEAGKVAVASSR